jgi:hypothetical protein
MLSQSEVLEGWFRRRTERDLVLKNEHWCRQNRGGGSYSPRAPRRRAPRSITGFIFMSTSKRTSDRTPKRAPTPRKRASPTRSKLIPKPPKRASQTPSKPIPNPSKPTSKRDRSVGAGYEYQWDVALHILLRFAIREGEAAQPVIRDSLAWLGPIATVFLEGNDQQGGRLEDVGLRSGTGRELHFQIKETDEDLSESPWRATSSKFIEFMERVAHRKRSADRRFVFLVSGLVHNSIRVLFASDEALQNFHSKISKQISAHNKRHSR